ncbi:erythroblast NAD(P)(+)--arginine ADP-ribosyltransferase-like [Sylvia atricapilla]|uniref:erythroblast NAD(P)(+)--arginine ADP-ribosyltransferase-like n=1 Tax=Sylvia atricapilla TaxID=48155 RepID=UPI003395F21A
MAPLAHTLVLLAMVMATTTNKVKFLGMPQGSSIGNGGGCRHAMTELLPALKHLEFQQNPLFARVWVKAAAEWQRRGAPVTPLPSEQAIALMAYTMKDMYNEFNNAVHMVGRSRQEYRDNFHFKALHFLLTQAVSTLRDAEKGLCMQSFRKVCGVPFKAKLGDTIHFGELVAISINETTRRCPWKQTFFQVYTCQSVKIGLFSHNSLNCEILIPPFETLEVTQVTETEDETVIQLRSTGTSSNDDCVWLPGDTTGDSPVWEQGHPVLGTPIEGMGTGATMTGQRDGDPHIWKRTETALPWEEQGQGQGQSLFQPYGSVSLAPFHLGRLLLATTALAVATRIL